MLWQSTAFSRALLCKNCSMNGSCGSPGKQEKRFLTVHLHSPPSKALHCIAAIDDEPHLWGRAQLGQMLPDQVAAQGRQSDGTNTTLLRAVPSRCPAQHVTAAVLRTHGASQEDSWAGRMSVEAHSVRRTRKRSSGRLSMTAERSVRFSCFRSARASSRDMISPHFVFLHRSRQTRTHAPRTPQFPCRDSTVASFLPVAAWLALVAPRQRGAGEPRNTKTSLASTRLVLAYARFNSH